MDAASCAGAEDNELTRNATRARRRTQVVVSWLALVVLSLTLHLWGLGERSFHHDEAIHAKSAWDLAESGIYRYDPTYHGPLLYYLTAGAFLVFGDSDFTARLPIALAGVALLGVAWSLRRPLGPRAAWWTGLLVTLSPSFLFFGRFLRMDVLEVLCASASAVAVYRAVHGRPRSWVWAGLWAGLALATKENAYVTLALVACVAALIATVHGLRSSVPAVLGWLTDHRLGIIAGVGAAVVVTVVLFTVGFTYPGDWFFPGKAIGYWWGQHSIERVAGPWWYHLPRLLQYEFLVLFAALAWVGRRRRRMHLFEQAMLLFGVTSVIMYCYLGEKVPWLGVHQVWAFVPLAGLQLARTFGPRGRWWSRSLAATLLAATTVTSLVANFLLDEITPNQRRVESLHYVQTCPELLPIVREGERLANEGVDPVAAVGGEAGWPLAWYWRRTPVWWSEPQVGMRPPMVLAGVEQETEVRATLGPGYQSERVPLRAWWVPEEFLPPSPIDLLRYLTTRTPFGDLGASEIVLLRRVGDIPDEAVATDVPPRLETDLAVKVAHIVGFGRLLEPRGLAMRDDGMLAVADVGLSTVVFFDRDGKMLDLALPENLQQPEAVAWTPEGVLVVTDTWGHRVVVFNPTTGGLAPLPTPTGGWYGPRGVAVLPDGAVVVTDTGNKRVVRIARGGSSQTTWGREGSAPGELVEPVGVAALDNGRTVVCDTGNRRLQVMGNDGTVLDVVPLPEAWSDFYSRPQVTVVDDGLWIVTDSPATAVWVVRSGRAEQVVTGDEGISPAGVAWHEGTLWLSDLEGRVWKLEIDVEELAGR